jgi:ankyrin repeat protein
MTAEERLNHDLLTAAESGDLKKVKSSLELGAFLECRDENQHTPLFNATINGHLSIVKYLVGKNADINAQSSTSYYPTVLHAAVLSRQLEVAKYLIANNVEVDGCDTSGMTSLHHCCYSKDLEVVKLLVENKADVNAKDLEDKTPVLMAVSLDGLSGSFNLNIFLEKLTFSCLNIH